MLAAETVLTITLARFKPIEVDNENLAQLDQTSFPGSAISVGVGLSRLLKYLGGHSHIVSKLPNYKFDETIVPKPKLPPGQRLKQNSPRYR